jgi:hypothetical protein
MEFLERTSTNYVAERAATESGGRSPPAAKGGNSGKCFAFQGRQFCE